uniref:Lipoprotein n=1 Tax=viral metagenome TaxID=1070528 RepID=A0A6M3JRL2_9ZZZZ
MKKLFIVVVALAFLSGCATLGWKPTEDQLQKYEQDLRAANLTEAGLFIVFDSLCVSAVLDAKSCVIGYAADAEWDAAYTLAMKAIADYRAGTTDEEMMKKYFNEAMKSVDRIVKLIKDIIGKQPMAVKFKSLAPKK